MRARIPVVLALAALLAVACQDSPTDPVEQPVATAPEFNFMNGPEAPGRVLRYYSGMVTQDLFPETPAGVPWFLQFGIAPGDVLLSCGGGGSSTPRSVQEVRPNGGEKVILNELNKNAAVTVFLWDEVLYYYLEALDLISQGEDIDPLCYWMERIEPIAEGVAVLHSNEGPQGWHIRVNGTLDYMGSTYHVHWLLANPYTDKEILKKRIW